MYNLGIKQIRSQNLKHFLKARPGAYKKLAEMLGIGKSNISHYTKGDGLVPSKHTEKICEFLNLDLDTLADPLPEQSRRLGDLVPADPILQMVVYTWDKLDEEGREVVALRLLEEVRRCSRRDA